MLIHVFEIPKDRWLGRSKIWTNRNYRQIAGWVCSKIWTNRRLGLVENMDKSLTGSARKHGQIADWVCSKIWTHSVHMPILHFLDGSAKLRTLNSPRWRNKSNPLSKDLPGMRRPRAS